MYAWRGGSNAAHQRQGATAMVGAPSFAHFEIVGYLGDTHLLDYSVLRFHQIDIRGALRGKAYRSSSRRAPAAKALVRARCIGALNRATARVYTTPSPARRHEPVRERALQPGAGR